MRNKTSSTILALVAVLALLAGACSSDTPADTATGDGSRLGQKDDKKKKNGGPGAGGAKGDGKARGGKSKQASNGSDGQAGNTRRAPGGAASPPPASGAESAPTGFASDGPPSPVDPSLARRSSFFEEPSPDAKKEGALVPAYAELVECGVQGVGEQFEMHFEFNGDVPGEMPDKNTVMVIGFGMSAGGNETYGFTAQGSQEGWKAYAGAKDGSRKFPGEFLIRGNKIIMRAPWRFINGPRKFRWQVNATWFRSVANTTHYSFDQCPNDQPGQFPN